MSRVHPSNFNNTDFMVNNCDQFLSKMMKNKRPIGQVVDRPRTDVKIARDKSLPRPTNRELNTRQMAKQTTAPIRVEEPKRKPSTQELVHKEVFNNNMATVEVTVRTVAPKGHDINSTTPNQEPREPWGKLLANQRSDETVVPCHFGNFDPLRTLHFLSKELQLKIQNSYPGDPAVHQIVQDMQHAMQRLPPDVITHKHSELNTVLNIGDHEPPINLKRDIHYDNGKISKHSQTVIIGDIETKKIKQQLEDSALKLETTCKEMETVCNKLRNERDELQAMLLTERETVLTLRKELQERVSEKDDKINKEIQKLVNERDIFKKQLKDMQTKMEIQAGQKTEDIRLLVEELRSKQLTNEQENTARRNEVAMMKLERDKMNVLLECRDKQLRELRNELECIQQLVSSQLMEFKAKPAFSTTSTVLSSTTSQIWNTPSTIKSQKTGKSIHELFLNNDIMRKMLLNKDLQLIESGTITTMNADDIIREQSLQNKDDEIQEIPQRETDNKIRDNFVFISDIGSETNFNNRSTSPSIKDMFAEIKKQAFKKLEVNLPQPPTKDKDCSPEVVQVNLGSRESLSS